MYATPAILVARNLKNFAVKVLIIKRCLVKQNFEWSSTAYRETISMQKAMCGRIYCRISFLF